MPLHVSSTCAHHQEVKIGLHSLWYHHAYRWPSHVQVERGLSRPVLAASSVLYTTSCKHSLVLLRMGEIIARNMLS